MRTAIACISVGVLLATASALAKPAAAPTCKTAEINPVTGHVFCIDPIGAPVEAPPESVRPECEAKSRGQWSWAPNCAPVPKG